MQISDVTYGKAKRYVTQATSDRTLTDLTVGTAWRSGSQICRRYAMPAMPAMPAMLKQTCHAVVTKCESFVSFVSFVPVLLCCDLSLFSGAPGPNVEDRV